MLKKDFSKLSTIRITLLLFALIILPFFLSAYSLGIAIAMVFGAFLAQTWNLMSGYAGLFSFGHAAFVGIGAYTSSLLFYYFKISPWFGMLAGMLLSGLLGYFIAFLSVRYKLRGDYFALTTLAFAEILLVIANNTPFTLASNGVTIPFNGTWKDFMFQDKKVFYFIVLIMVVGVTVLIAKLQKTKTGLYFIAMRESEDAADALGVNIFRYKATAIVLSAMLASMGGTFYAQYYTYINAESVFASTISMDCVIPCIVGGSGTVVGPLIGTVLYKGFKEYTTVAFSKVPGANMVAYAILMILFLRFFPRGIMGIIADVREKAQEKKVMKNKAEVK